MSSIVDQLNAIAARWWHGHTELTSGCALCNAEFDEVYRLLHGKSSTIPKETQP